jgi:hypothetical protein
VYQVAYGRDGLGMKTRETLLHSQLQEGLKYDLMRSPAVSGALSYTQLCMGAKYEEKRVADLSLSARKCTKKPVDKSDETQEDSPAALGTRFKQPTCTKWYECGSGLELQEIHTQKGELGSPKEPSYLT